LTLFAPFSRKKSSLQQIKQIWKLSLGGATIESIDAPMRGKNYQNLRKRVQSLCAPLRPFRSELKEIFHQSILSHVLYMCTRIKISRYLVRGCHEKLSSSYRWYQKRTVEPMFVPTESLLSRAIFKNVLRDFYRGLIICSCAPMFKILSTPPDGDSTEYQI